MTLPMVALAVLSVVAGFVNTPWYHGLAGWLSADGLTAHYEAPAFVGWVTALTVLVALLGIGLAASMYVREAISPAALARRLEFGYDMLLHKYWIDELYGATVVRGAFGLGRFLNGVDRYVVEGLVALVGGMFRLLGFIGSALQTGKPQSSNLVGVLGLVLLLVILTLGGVWG